MSGRVVGVSSKQVNQKTRVGAERKKKTMKRKRKRGRVRKRKKKGKKTRGVERGDCACACACATHVSLRACPHTFPRAHRQSVARAHPQSRQCLPSHTSAQTRLASIGPESDLHHAKPSPPPAHPHFIPPASPLQSPSQFTESLFAACVPLTASQKKSE